MNPADKNKGFLPQHGKGVQHIIVLGEESNKEKLSVGFSIFGGRKLALKKESERRPRSPAPHQPKGSRTL